MQPLGILETCLYAENLEETAAFYSRVLGLTEYARADGRHVFFRCGQGMFLLFSPSATLEGGELPPHGTRGSGHAAFAIDENQLDEWRTHLIRHEVQIDAEHTWPNGGKSLYFSDPAGNSLELTSPQIWGLGSP